MDHAWCGHLRKRYYAMLFAPPRESEALPLAKHLIARSLDVLAEQKRNRCCVQRRNLLVLSRRVRILFVFLEEICNASALLPSALLSLSELHVVLQGIKLIFRECTESSRLCLLVDHRRLSKLSHMLTLDMATSLENLPLSLMEHVPWDVREQVGLLIKQCKKVRMCLDPMEQRLWFQVRRAISVLQGERKSMPEQENLRQIFSCLDLRNASDCEREIAKLEAALEEEDLWEPSCVHEREISMADLLRFVRHGRYLLYGVTEAPKAPHRSSLCKQTGAALPQLAGKMELDIPIPDDFRCPITLELMRDPVIVATGHTYERSAIARWLFETHHRTCPKSGIVLQDTTLVPNHAVRSLIRLWCSQNNVVLDGNRASAIASELVPPP
ncbi:hypothetical protein KP509_10G010200 [Ceratopteris richardii]|uniref:RING-type E3 ubiquitin transferase n=1 Tax=Ceratopteris richardii TaxID=49495 RepID=A0A8T2TW60_CERRI|nr:hypothetical protein KP509_10G010200 [Ceratopteris richardii]